MMCTFIHTWPALLGKGEAVLPSLGNVQYVMVQYLKKVGFARSNKFSIREEELIKPMTILIHSFTERLSDYLHVTPISVCLGIVFKCSSIKSWIFWYLNSCRNYKVALGLSLTANSSYFYCMRNHTQINLSLSTNEMWAMTEIHHLAVVHWPAWN